MKTPELPEWARHPHAWWQLHINSPEDELRIRFAELGKIGEECRASRSPGNPTGRLERRWAGSGQSRRTILIHGLVPLTNSRRAIARYPQSCGVKLILFAKFTWADRATDWFREDLHRLAIKDPYGDYYHYNGYQYNTATQALNINTKRLIPNVLRQRRVFGG